MPRIIRVRPIASPVTPLHLPERVDNPSPDGESNLVFHTPREWHMGADGWQVKLLHRGRDVTRKHRDFFKVAEGKGFRYEPYFRPWSFDSRSLSVLTWDKAPVHLYEVAAKRDTHVAYQPPFGYVYTAQWAPDKDRLLVTTWSEGVLLDQAGQQHALVPWGIAEREIPHTDWLNAGQCFFLVAREASDSSKTRIRFFSGVDGALLETHDLDPKDLVPYNWEDYVELSREGLSLISADAGFRSVGSMLDTWSGVKFDQASNTLSLGVYRPVSPPYREGEDWGCKIKDVWVAIEVASQ